MYVISKADYKQAVAFSDFFLPHILESRGIDRCMFYIGYDDETLEVISAAAVYPAQEGARLLSISVSKDHIRQGMGRKLIDYMAHDIGFMYAINRRTIPVMRVSEIYSVEIWEGLGAFLEESGFTNIQTEGLIEVTLDELNSSELLDKALKHKSNDIIPLKDVSGNMLRNFGNHLTQNSLYPGIDPKEYDQDCSMFYIVDDSIRGCILMSRLADGSLSNDWVYLDSDVSNRVVLVNILAASAQTAGKMYPGDTKVGVLPVNDVSKKLIQKLAPDAKVSSQIRTYERVM